MLEKQWQSLEEKGTVGAQPGHSLLTRWLLYLAEVMSPDPILHLPEAQCGSHWVRWHHAHTAP